MSTFKIYIVCGPFNSKILPNIKNMSTTVYGSPFTPSVFPIKYPIAHPDPSLTLLTSLSPPSTAAAMAPCCQPVARPHTGISMVTAVRGPSVNWWHIG